MMLIVVVILLSSLLFGSHTYTHMLTYHHLLYLFRADIYVERTLPGWYVIMTCVCMLMRLLVRELLNSGVSPDLVNEDGLTALHQVRTHTHKHQVAPVQ